MLLGRPVHMELLLELKLRLSLRNCPNRQGQVPEDTSPWRHAQWPPPRQDEQLLWMQLVQLVMVLQLRLLIQQLVLAV